MAEPAVIVGVTGASGFVGRHLTARFLETGVLVRRLALPHEPQDPHQLQKRIREELSGVHALIHLAARVHHPEDPDDRWGVYQWANVELSRLLLQAAGAAGVRGFVFASSVKTVGEKSDAPWTEATIPRPVGPYAQSKLAAEVIVAEQGRQLGMRTVSLRFPLIYGPGMQANMLRLFRAVERGLPLPLGASHQRRSLLYVENAVAAIEAALRHAGPEPGLFFVRDGDDVSASELVRAIAASLGRPARLVAVPVSLLRIAGWVGDLISRVVPSPIDSGMVARLTESLQVDDTLIRRWLGYAPRFSLSEGLAQTAEWFRANQGSGPTQDHR